MDTNFYDKHINRTSEWYTPFDLYKELDSEFHFVTDPAAEPTNRLGCKVYITKSQNGLDSSYSSSPSPSSLLAVATNSRTGLQAKDRLRLLFPHLSIIS
jgi:hypothetical protein